MRRGLFYVLARLVVLLIAAAAYLLLLPVEISTIGGLSIRFPEFIRTSGDGLAYPDPINWNYVLLLPVALLIIVIGFEIIRLTMHRR